MSCNGPTLPSDMSCGHYPQQRYPLLDKLLLQITGQSISPEVVSLSVLPARNPHNINARKELILRLPIQRYRAVKPKYEKLPCPYDLQRFVVSEINSILYFNYGSVVFDNQEDRNAAMTKIDEEYRVTERCKEDIRRWEAREDRKDLEFIEALTATIHGWVIPEETYVEELYIVFKTESELKQELEYHCLKRKEKI